MEIGGGNNYKLEHMSKRKLRREGTIMESITCAPDVLQSAFCLLNPMVDQVLSAKEIVPTEASIDLRDMLCAYCGKKATGAHHCSLCKKIVHSICGHADGSEGYGASVVCYTCRPEIS